MRKRPSSRRTEGGRLPGSARRAFALRLLSGQVSNRPRHASEQLRTRSQVRRTILTRRWSSPFAALESPRRPAAAGVTPRRQRRFVVRSKPRRRSRWDHAIRWSCKRSPPSGRGHSMQPGARWMLPAVRFSHRISRTSDRSPQRATAHGTDAHPPGQCHRGAADAVVVAGTGEHDDARASE